MIKQKTIAGILALMMMSSVPLSAESTIKPNGCKGPTLCDSYPIIDGCGWQIDVGLILDQMRVTGTAAFFTHAGGPDTVADGQTWENPGRKNTIFVPAFDLDPGLRVGLGYATRHDDWNLNAFFEWLSSTGSVYLQLDDNATIIPLNRTQYFQPDSTNLAYALHEASSSIAIDYYLLDVVLSKGSYFSNKFSYEPFAGIKAAWINYNTTTWYGQDESTGAQSLASSEVLMTRAINSFWGVGPMFGVNANYHLFVGWSIFSSSNLSVLLGEARLASGDGSVTTAAYPTSNVTRVVLQVLSPTVRSIFGLQYDMDIFKEKQHLRLRLGFDGRYYFNQYPKINRVALRSNAGSNDPDSQELAGGPQVVENASFGMVGFLLDLAWDY